MIHISIYLWVYHICSYCVISFNWSTTILLYVFVCLMKFYYPLPTETVADDNHVECCEVLYFI